MPPSKKRSIALSKDAVASANKKSRQQTSDEPDVETGTEPTVKNSRSKKVVKSTASSERPTRNAKAVASQPRSTRSSNDFTPINTVKVSGGPNQSLGTKGTPSRAGKRVIAKPKANSSQKLGKSNEVASVSSPEHERKKTTTKLMKGRRQANISVEVVDERDQTGEQNYDDEEADEDNDGPAYWLMKAEPESRIEKGKDVKFSIDDLKAASVPEGWDGVRNMAARNNMRAMTKGDMAFFYHSNCKVPGIVGTMEIVKEHSIDETAFDPEHPYYDQKSTVEKPKWDLVHVEFRQKFPEIIKLKELQKFAKPGGVLENLQTLKQSRLSVSKVTKNQWNFIIGLVDKDDIATASAQYQPPMAT